MDFLKTKQYLEQDLLEDQIKFDLDLYMIFTVQLLNLAKIEKTMSVTDLSGQKNSYGKIDILIIPSLT